MPPPPLPNRSVVWDKFAASVAFYRCLWGQSRDTMTRSGRQLKSSRCRFGVNHYFLQYSSQQFWMINLLSILHCPCCQLTRQHQENISEPWFEPGPPERGAWTLLLCYADPLNNSCFGKRRNLSISASNLLEREGQVQGFESPQKSSLRSKIKWNQRREFVQFQMIRLRGTIFEELKVRCSLL